jgi:diacylglycerol kinase family enzyme
MKVTSQQPLYVHCDGEIFSGFGTNVRRLNIEVLPKALRVLKQA